MINYTVKVNVVETVIVMLIVKVLTLSQVKHIVSQYIVVVNSKIEKCDNVYNFKSIKSDGCTDKSEVGKVCQSI